YMVDGYFDAGRMIQETDEVLSRLASTGRAPGKGGNRVQDALSSPNCGGYPRGTTISQTVSNCLGQTVTTYQCMASGNGNTSYDQIWCMS
ncbi:MAG TPA: hypothetical protein VK979_01770, partial [Guyparkeria sp.]|nr:hypothetical protein [Guyparkeria sp.]